VLHGTQSKYSHGCRCDECRRAHADHQGNLVQGHRENPPSWIPHGTIGGYSNYACRCRACTSAWADYCYGAKKRRKGTLAADDPRHGTVNGYGNYGCRCQPCKDAHNAARKALRAYKKSKGDDS
jgi:hypothetical protein